MSILAMLAAVATLGPVPEAVTPHEQRTREVARLAKEMSSLVVQMRRFVDELGPPVPAYVSRQFDDATSLDAGPMIAAGAR